MKKRLWKKICISISSIIGLSCTSLATANYAISCSAKNNNDNILNNNYDLLQLNKPFEINNINDIGYIVDNNFNPKTSFNIGGEKLNKYNVYPNSEIKKFTSSNKAIDDLENSFKKISLNDIINDLYFNVALDTYNLIYSIRSDLIYSDIIDLKSISSIKKSINLIGNKNTKNNASFEIKISYLFKNKESDINFDFNFKFNNIKFVPTIIYDVNNDYLFYGGICIDQNPNSSLEINFLQNINGDNNSKSYNFNITKSDKYQIVKLPNNFKIIKLFPFNKYFYNSNINSFSFNFVSRKLNSRFLIENL